MKVSKLQYTEKGVAKDLSLFYTKELVNIGTSRKLVCLELKRPNIQGLSEIGGNIYNLKRAGIPCVAGLADELLIDTKRMYVPCASFNFLGINITYTKDIQDSGTWTTPDGEPINYGKRPSYADLLQALVNYSIRKIEHSSNGAMDSINDKINKGKFKKWVMVRFMVTIYLLN